MNARSQFYRIENGPYTYTWGGMRTNDDLTRIDRQTRKQMFLGPLCGDVRTISKDPSFTSFIIPGKTDEPSQVVFTNPPAKPDSIHFAKCSQERIDWKTKTYREIVPEWGEEGMGRPEEMTPYHGPEWPDVLKGAKFLETELLAAGIEMADIQWR